MILWQCDSHEYTNNAGNHNNHNKRIVYVVKNYGTASITQPQCKSVVIQGQQAVITRVCARNNKYAFSKIASLSADIAEMNLRLVQQCVPSNRHVDLMTGMFETGYGHPS